MKFRSSCLRIFTNASCLYMKERKIAFFALILFYAFIVFSLIEFNLYIKHVWPLGPCPPIISSV